MPKPKSNDDAPEVATRKNLTSVPTTGEILPNGVLLEIVRDPADYKTRLLVWSGGTWRISSNQILNTKCFVPSESMRMVFNLPSEPESYGSTEELFSAISGFLIDVLGIGEQDAAIPALFCLTSFFPDCISLSPSLLIFGDFSPAISLLRALGCICRHPLLLAQSRVGGLAPELKPTRLVCQPDSSLNTLLAAWQFRGFGISDRGFRSVSGAAAVYVGDWELRSPFADASLWLRVSNTTRSFTAQDELRNAATIQKLQNQLLGYRLANLQQVRSSVFDAAEFSGTTRELACALGRCVPNSPDLQARILELLTPRDDGERSGGANPFESAIIEALLVACHERKSSVRVGEVAGLANGILGRNGEQVRLGSREVGAKLKQLGFRTARLDGAGRGIYLVREQCAQIHRLGRDLRVPTLREGLPGCPDCVTK